MILDEITTLHDRLLALEVLQKKIFDSKNDVTKALMDDLGKSAEEAVVTEVIPVISEIRHIRSNLSDWYQPKKVNKTMLHATSSAYIQYQPKGKVLILSPWNYPFNLVLSPLVLALSAGNTVVVKPSEYTPNTNKVIKHIIAGCFSSELCSVIEGDAGVASELTHQLWDHIFFTGSPEIGKKVMKAAAENLVPVTLELGGKSPCIITADADLGKAARRIAWGKFTNCGQTCIAPDYLLVHADVKERFLDLLKTETMQRYPQACKGQTDDPGYGKIIHDRHFQRLVQMLNDAVSKKAQLLMPNFNDKDHRFISPAILELPGENQNMTLMQDEIFGPILPVITWKHREEVFSRIANNPKPLAAYVFCGSRSEILFWRDNIRTGGFVANDILSHFAHNNLPFGGIGSSGHGRSHGFFGFREFSNEMAVLESGIGPSGAELVGAPYTDIKRKIINAALKLV